MGLAAVAASLFACTGHTQSSRPAPTVSVGVEDLTVTASNAQAVMTRIAASHMEPMDKDRFAAFVETHQKSPGAYDGKTVRQIINLQEAYEIGLRMTAQTEIDDRRHRSELAKLMQARVDRTREADRMVELTLSIANTSVKTVKSLEFGLFVMGSDGKRIAMTEFRTGEPIAPHGTRTITVPMRYVRFGADAGAMVEAAGRPKTYSVVVKEIKYTDGTDAGYDD